MLKESTPLSKKMKFKPPGMRIVKTSLAVLFCFVIDYLRGYPYIYNSAVSSIISMQQNLPNTKATAKNRIVGTLISGFYSVVVIFILTRILSIITLPPNYKSHKFQPAQTNLSILNV